MRARHDQSVAVALPFDRTFRCQFAASRCQPNIDRGGRSTASSLSIVAMVFWVMNMTPKVGSKRGSLIQVVAFASCHAPQPPANGNSLLHARGQRGDTPRTSGGPSSPRSFNIPSSVRPSAGGNRYPLSSSQTSSIADADATDGADDRGNIKEAFAEMKWVSDTKNPSIRTAAEG